MIRVEHLYKSFGDKQVLNDICTEFSNGHIHQIIGQSGSGKTVLLKCIVGLLQADKGRILFDERDRNLLKTKELNLLRQEMGMLFQASALFDSMTIEENVMFPLRMFSSLSEKEQYKRAHYCLDEVGLSATYRLFPNELSGGMQKRAAIARALVLKPKYLFCDEPNSGLDPLTAIRIDELIAELTRNYGMTTLINTHDMNSVMSIGEHVLFVHQGRIGWEGSKNQLFVSGCEALDYFLFSSEIFQRFQQELRNPHPLTKEPQ